MLKKGSNFLVSISIVFTPILFAQSSTFLKLLLIKSFSRSFNNSIDHKPKILCLLLFDLTKYNKLSFALILFWYSSIIDEYQKRIKLKDSLLYFVKSNNKRHNIFGLWSIKLLKLLENDLINNFRKVEDWANKIGVKTIDIESKKFDPFFNINTKEDLEEAKKILKKRLKWLIIKKLKKS